MIVCSKCGANNTDDSLFCSTCGNRLDEPQMVPCANCGKMLKADAKFCSQCGSSVGSNLNLLFTASSPNNSGNYEPTEILTSDDNNNGDVMSVFDDGNSNQTAYAPTELLTQPDVPAEPVQTQQADPMDVFDAKPQNDATEILTADDNDNNIVPTELLTQPDVPAEPVQTQQADPMAAFNAEPQNDATEILTPSEDDLPVNPVNSDVMSIFDEGKPVQTAYAPTEILTQPDVPAQPVQQSNPMDIFNDLPQHDATEILSDNQEPSFTPPVEIPGADPYQYSNVSAPANNPVADTSSSSDAPKAKKAKKAKKKSKAPIVIIVILLLVAAIGAGGYYAYSQGMLDGVIEKITGTKSDDEDQANEEEEILTLDGMELPAIPDMTYTGNEIVPAISLKLDGESLTEGNDYTIECTNNINVGTATIVITGIGDVAGSVSGQFNIVYGNELLDDPNNAAMTNYIIGLYSNIWGRNPSLTELVNDCTQIRNGNVVMDAYILGFFNNSEFSSMSNSLTLPEGYTGTREDYVVEYAVSNCLYMGILGRTPDDAGLEYWSGVVREQGIYPAAQALLTDPNVVAQINAVVGV